MVFQTKVIVVRFLNLRGQVKFKNIEKNRVKWDGDSKSKFQKSVRDFLRPYWDNDVVFEEMPLVGTRLRLDFYNSSKKLGVEVQGAQHSKYNSHFHGNRNGFRRSLERDSKKEEWCEINKIKLIEIFPEDLKRLSKEWILSEFGVYL